MHTFFFKEEAIFVVHRIMSVMQSVVLKKQTRQFEETLCRALLVAKLTTIIPITPPDR
jgi:hypothetical protein